MKRCGMMNAAEGSKRCEGIQWNDMQDFLICYPDDIPDIPRMLPSDQGHGFTSLWEGLI